MEEQLISFETAKIAKEKGFDEKVYREYDKSGYLRCTSKSADVVLGPYDELLKSTEYPAPTQSLLQKWLREVHNIIVTSKPYQDDVSNETDEDIEFQTLWENEILDVKDSYNIFSDNTFYHSYEEALEIGLQESLKLIK